MTILYRKHYRLTDLSDKNSAKKVFPTITYEYGQAATLTEVAKEISGNSGVSEGETISVLKDFRTLMRKLLFSGHSSWLRHPGCMSGNYSARFSVIEVITSVIHLPILSIISCNFAM